MFRTLAVSAALALGLAGCTLGISPDRPSPSGDYKLGVNYQEAYRTARHQARQCLLGEGGYRVVDDLDSAGRTARVRVVAPFTDNDIVRINIKALGPQESEVRIVVWGESIWNGDAVIAMRDAIRFGIPSCTSWMPSNGNDPVRAPR